MATGQGVAVSAILTEYFVGEVVELPGAELKAPTEEADSWARFLDDMSRRPMDVTFMRERPMNHLPGEDPLCAEKGE